MTHKAKPILVGVGAILIALFPLSRWIAAEYLRNLPREYFSVVIVETRPFAREIGESKTMSGRNDPQFLATQFQVIKGSEVLNSVIEKLDLVKKLSPAGMTMPTQWVTETLARIIIVQEQRNTTLIEIGVYHADKQLAADIANTIAITYRDKRIEERNRYVDEKLAEMKDELQAKRAELGKLFLEASRIRQEDNIVDADPERADAVISIAEGDGKTSTNRYVEKKSAYLMAKQHLLSIEQRLAAVRFDSGGLSMPPVYIWQRAVPARHPAGPDVAGILNAIGASLGGIGVLLILVALLTKSPIVQPNANGGASGSKD